MYKLYTAIRIGRRLFSIIPLHCELLQKGTVKCRVGVDGTYNIEGVQGLTSASSPTYGVLGQRELATHWLQLSEQIQRNAQESYEVYGQRKRGL